MKTATQTLRDEHVLILRALDVLERALEPATPLSPGWWAQLLTWLRAFADRSHHAKEEAALFPALERAGLPREGGPIATMLAEHDEGRALIQAMDLAPDAGARAAAARRYVALLRAHIARENEVLFPMADAVLDDEGQRDLARAFEAADARQGMVASLDYADAVLQALGAGLEGRPAPGAPATAGPGRAP